MADDIDYNQVAIPDSESPENYHYTQRRAEILNAVKEAGHPGSINQKALAQRYGVSEAQICKDMKIIRSYIVDQIGETRVDALSQAVFDKAIRALMEEGEYMDAVRATEAWNEWLFNRGKIDKVADKHDVTVREEENETEDWIVISDDEDAEIGYDAKNVALDGEEEQ